jgi:drug/metabolite transporter (DMT)-like permease
MTPDNRYRLAMALLFITPALWTVNYLVARSAADVVAPHALALGRWLIAFVVMYGLNRRAIHAHRGEIWTSRWQYLVLGALGMWMCGAFVYIGGRTSPALTISLIYSLSPVLIALFSIGLFGERMSRGQLAGAVLALAGALMIVLKGHPETLFKLRFTTGDLWIAAAAFAWTIYSLLLRKWPSAMDSLARLTIITGAGVLVLIPATLIEAFGCASAMCQTQTSWWALLLIASAALIPGLGAYSAYSYMQAQLGAARTGLVQYLGPPYAALAGWLVLGEGLHGYHLVGAAMILPGIFLATRRLVR